MDHIEPGIDPIRLMVGCVLNGPHRPPDATIFNAYFSTGHQYSILCKE